MSIELARGKQIIAGRFATNYHESGAGKALILLHGSGAGVSACENWKSVIPELARTHRVLAFDIVGFGLTDCDPCLPLNFRVWVEHVIGFMDAMGVERASIVGNSFGGAVALATALKFPNRIDRLVLMGTPAGEFERSNRSSSWNYEPTLHNMRELLVGFPYDKSIVTETMVQARFEMSQRTDSRAAYRRLIPEPDAAKGTSRVQGISSADLGKVLHPVLVLHGREDGVIPKECGSFIFQNCPNAELHMFGNCGHWVQLEKQRDFVNLSASFLTRDV